MLDGVIILIMNKVKDIKPITNGDKLLEYLITYNMSEDKLNHNCKFHGDYDPHAITCPYCESNNDGFESYKDYEESST